jgi:hypothetical protein
MPVENPGTLLAFLAAIFCPPTSAAFGKLPGEFFPFSALIVCTLSDPATAIVLAAQITHDNSGPVLHILTVMSDSKFFDEREYVEIVWEKVFFLLRIAGRGG